MQYGNKVYGGVLCSSDDVSVFIAATCNHPLLIYENRQSTELRGSVLFFDQSQFTCEYIFYQQMLDSSCSGGGMSTQN